ncbi:hypothetical protein ACHAQA_009112 [Verticillium albo-atrum]
MAPHKIIADSDDEDDFTPGQSPVKPQTPATALDLHSPTAGNGTGSTDPGFFQAIYSEQQEAVATDCSIGPDKSFDLVDTTSKDGHREHLIPHVGHRPSLEASNDNQHNGFQWPYADINTWQERSEHDEGRVGYTKQSRGRGAVETSPEARFAGQDAKNNVNE